MIDQPDASASATADPRAALPLESAKVQATVTLPELPKNKILITFLDPAYDPKDPGFAHFATLRFEKSLVGDLFKAQTYLGKDAEAVKLLSALTRDTNGYIGRGHYEVYDVAKDLHGRFPDQTHALSIDARGNVHAYEQHVVGQHHAR